MSQDVSHHTPDPIDLRIRNAAGTVEITATDTDTSTVAVAPIDGSNEAAEFADRTTVELSSRHDRLVVEVPERRGIFTIRQPRLAVRVTVPTGSRVLTRTASAEVTCTGRVGALTAHAASGNLRVEDVDGDVEVHVASGDVRIGSSGRTTARTASGDIALGHTTGPVEVHSASGSVHVGLAEASVQVRTASGGVEIDEASSGTVSLNAASGDLRVGVRSGVVARLDLTSLSGRVRSELPVDDDAPAGGAPLDISARTVSGDLLVTSATAAGSG